MVSILFYGMQAKKDWSPATSWQERLVANFLC